MEEKGPGRQTVQNWLLSEKVRAYAELGEESSKGWLTGLSRPGFFLCPGPENEMSGGACTAGLCCCYRKTGASALERWGGGRLSPQRTTHCTGKQPVRASLVLWTERTVHLLLLFSVLERRPRALNVSDKYCATESHSPSSSLGGGGLSRQGLYH